MKLFPAAGILTAAALLLSGCSAGGSQSGPQMCIRDRKALCVIAGGKVQKGPGIVWVGGVPHQGAAVGDQTGALLWIDQGDAVPGVHPLEGSLLQSDSSPAAASGHGGEDVAGALQLAAVQGAGKAADRVLSVAAQGVEHGHKSGEAGAGYAGVGKGDPAPKLRTKQVLPAGELLRGCLLYTSRCV